MAKQRSVPAAQDSSITFVVMNVRGSDETIQSALKAIGTTLTQAIPSPARRLPPQLSVTERQPLIPGLEPEEELPENVIEIAEGTSTQEVRASKQPTGPRKPPKSPTVLKIDFNAAEVPLKTFLDSYSTDEVTKRYLLIGYWFLHHGGVKEVSMNHIHSAFRWMSWTTPRDASQPLRDLKSRLEWFDKGSVMGTYAINHVGENIVMQMKAKG
jgi:hypothetical protein